jgi:PAS domain S-box-containing protein
LQVVLVNPVALKLLGKPEHEILNRSLLDIFSSSSQTLQKQCRRALNAGDNQPVRFEDRFLVNGLQLWLQFTLTPQLDHLFITFQQPVHQPLESALIKSQKEFQALISAVPDQIMRLTANGVCQFFRDSVPPVFSDTNPAYKNIKDIFPEDVAGLFSKYMAACFTGGEPQEFEYQLIIDNQPHQWSARMVPMSREEVLVVSRNATDLKYARINYEEALANEREQRLIAETLAEVTLALTAHTNLKDVLDEVLRQTHRLVPYRTAHIMLLKGEQLHIASWQGYRELGSEALVSNLVQPLANFPVDAEVIRSRQALLISDTREEPSWVVQTETAWVRSHVVLPITLGDQVLGILRLDANTPNAFSHEALARLQPLTNAAAIAMQNANLYDRAQEEVTERAQAEQETRRRNRELAMFNRIIATSTAYAQVNQVMQIVCEELAGVYGVADVTAARFNSQQTSLTMVAEYTTAGRPVLLGRNLSVDQPLIRELVVHKTPIVLENAADDPRLATIGQGLVSVLLLPLVFEGRIIGSLLLATDRPHTFSEQEINLALRVADQTAGVLVRIELNRDYRRLSEAIEQSAEIVIITDIDRKLQYVNPAFEQITGYTRNEILGNTLSKLHSGKQDSTFYKTLWDSINQGEVWQGRIINKKKDGSLFTVDTTISPVRDEHGVITNYVGLQRDITRELKLEEQYHQAQKMEAVGLLAGGVAHDFNNLLTVINGFAEMIQFELPPDNLHLQKLASRVRYSGTRAAALVRQLLAFSRREYVEPKVLNINKVVTDTGKMLERLIEENITLTTNLSPDLWSVKIDPHQLEQIIVNLTVNSRDAMPDGGTLTIETINKFLDDEYSADHLGLQPGRYVQLIVSDTGVGMSTEVKERVFEPFFTTKEQGKGTGLGLATVFGIVQQHYGQILVYSESGRGTTFNIYLPAIVQVHDGEALKPETEGFRVAANLFWLLKMKQQCESWHVICCADRGIRLLRLLMGKRLSAWPENRYKK